MFSFHFTASNQVDEAFASFSLFNMIIYFVWGIILLVHRRAMMVSQHDIDANKAAGMLEDGATYNPTRSVTGFDEFVGEDKLDI